MNEDELKQTLRGLSQKIDAVYSSVERTRKYFLVVLVISVIAFVLPLVGLFFVIPTFLSTYIDMGGF